LDGEKLFQDFRFPLFFFFNSQAAVLPSSSAVLGRVRPREEILGNIQFEQESSSQLA
jgi:hypothetical protein